MTSQIKHRQLEYLSSSSFRLTAKDISKLYINGRLSPHKGPLMQKAFLCHGITMKPIESCNETMTKPKRVYILLNIL